MEYSDFLNARGRPDEAIAERVRILEIDPLSVSDIAAVGYVEYWAGRYDPAIANARSVLTIAPNNLGAHLCLGLSLEQKRQYPTAIEELQRQQTCPMKRRGWLFLHMPRRSREIKPMP